MHRVSMQSTVLALMMGATSATFAQVPNVNDPPPANTQEERQRERQEERRREREEAERNRNQNPQQNNNARQLEAPLHRASEMSSVRVDTKNGEKIGDLRNFAIHAENGGIRYAIVDNGKGTYYPIPYRALKFQDNGRRAVVDTTLERMKDAPTFNPEGWDTIGDNKWGAIVYQFYGINRTAEEDKERPDFVSSTAVRGGKVQNRQGDSLGSVRDVVIDSNKGLVEYAVLDFGNQDKHFAVPWQAMNFREDGRTIVVRGVERDDLRNAPGFPNNRWPTPRELKWDGNTNYDSRPPTWIYGYNDVNGGNNGGGNGNAGNGNSGGDRGLLGGWQTNSKYGEMFNDRTIDRMRGRVVRTETVTPLPGMDPGTALVVRVEGRGNFVVHLGPEWFIKRQQDRFNEGDEIEVNGSRVEIDNKPIIMATQIRHQGRTLTLRESNGVPAWDAWQERR